MPLLTQVSRVLDSIDFDFNLKILSALSSAFHPPGFLEKLSSLILFSYFFIIQIFRFVSIKVVSIVRFSLSNCLFSYNGAY